MVSFMGFALSGILTLIGKNVTLLLLGSQWEEAGNILCVFSIGIGIHILHSTNLWLHLSLGKTDRLLKWSALESILICFSFLFGFPYGAFGIAVSYTVCMHILTWPCLWYAGKPIEIKLSSVISKIWKFYLAAFLGTVLCFSLYQLNTSIMESLLALNIFFQILVTTLIFLIIYVSIVIILFRNISPIIDFLNIVRRGFLGRTF
jgi:PST family polysaccharide transporter